MRFSYNWNSDFLPGDEFNQHIVTARINNVTAKDLVHAVDCE